VPVEQHLGQGVQRLAAALLLRVTHERMRGMCAVDYTDGPAVRRTRRGLLGRYWKYRGSRLLYDHF